MVVRICVCVCLSVCLYLCVCASVFASAFVSVLPVFSYVCEQGWEGGHGAAPAHQSLAGSATHGLTIFCQRH